MTYQPVLGATPDAIVKDYDSGQCDVLTSNASQLHAERLKLTKPSDYVIVPDLISKEPLGPAVRERDQHWLNIVKWTHVGSVNAEELGVTTKTLEEALKSDKPDVKRLLGTEGDYGEHLGLTNDWVARIIRQIGNYGEVYERNVDVRSLLGIPRGIKETWTKGGIMYAPPIR